MIVVWRLGKRADGRVTFSFRGCAKEFGTRCGGSRREFLKEAVGASIGPASQGGLEYQHRKHVMRHFGILDEVDCRDSFDGQASNPERSRQMVLGFMVTN